MNEVNRERERGSRIVEVEDKQRGRKIRKSRIKMRQKTSESIEPNKEEIKQDTVLTIH